MSNKDLLSVIIPAHNEEEVIEETLEVFCSKLETENIPYEILVVNDHSTDGTYQLLVNISEKLPCIRFTNNEGLGGFGNALKWGINQANGSVLAFVMADLSDDPDDLVKFYRKIEEGYDCVFGTRFSKGGKTVDYPFFKLFLNRIFNNIIRLFFQLRYNDVTNAFKMYRKSTIDGLKPILSHHFNITVELPLKAIIRGYHYAIVPNTWLNRKGGVSKLNIKEMGSRYFFILFYCFIEKWLSRGDFHPEKKRNKTSNQKVTTTKPLA